MTDCNKIQANSVDNNKIQASLTEQLYAGTLPTGHYYFNNGVETYIVFYKNINSKHLILQEPEGLKVLSEVPSYEEYEKLNWYAGNGVEENQELKMENTKLKTENKWYSEQLNEAVKKIAKLKEQQKLTSDCKTLSLKLLQVKPELRGWLEVNYGEYL